MTNYRDNLNVLRRAFPQPVSDQEHDAWFVFSELREDRYWTTFNNTPRFATVRDDGSASVCLDCGKVSALLTVDVKEAKRVLDKWGTDALKSRLAIGPLAP